MKRYIGLGCALMALMLAPSVAFADETPAPAAAAADTSATTDTVHLRNGGMLRGRVTEIVPGDHVTVLMIAGEQKRIVWSEVDRVVVGAPTLPGTTPSSPAAAAGMPAPMVGPLVRVHIKSSGPVILHRRPAGSTDFVQACESPCDIELPIGDTYKIGGSGITTTKDFRLDAAPGRTVEISVDGPSWLGIIGGGLMTIVGGLTAYVGVVFALAGGTASGSSSGKEIRNIGIGAMVVGASLIAVGLVIVYPSTKTDLSQQNTTPGKDAFVRTPVWRTVGTATEIPAQATFPVLFEHTF